MKKIALLLTMLILNLGCNLQEFNKDKNSQNDNDSIAQIAESPEGTWKVNKEFDEDGNLIRYDSIYSWSSNNNLNELALSNPDSLLKSFRSKFYRNFSKFDDQRFENLFAEDSLFTDRFFDDRFFDSQFGEDFMNIDRVRERMETMQQQFLERYRSEFDSLEGEGSEERN